MDATSLTLQLSHQQYERLAQFARNRQIDVSEIAEMAIEEWLERQVRLVRARELMRELGRGLGTGSPKMSTARDHDKLLYSSKRS